MYIFSWQNPTFLMNGGIRVRNPCTNPTVVVKGGIRVYIPCENPTLVIYFGHESHLSAPLIMVRKRIIHHNILAILNLVEL